MRRNVFAIGPGVPFLKTFVDAFFNGEIISTLTRDSPPLRIAKTTIYVPTQRAGRALAVEFAQATDKPAALLPRILPLGALDEQESVALFDANFDFDETVLPSIDPIDRRLTLALLARRWADALRYAVISIDPSGTPLLHERESLLVAASPTNAYALAGELAALIDEFIIENVDAHAIFGLAEEEFDRYWAITTDFLKIALRQWPEILKERGLVDKTRRDKTLIEAQITRIGRDDPDAPVIALGSTGANPSTARLLKAIARANNGAVVLPGVDVDLDADAWALIGHAADDRSEPAHSHPQTVLKRLLNEIGIQRDDIRILGAPTSMARARAEFVSQAMRPADTTEQWRVFRATRGKALEQALETIACVEAPDERLEALTLALFVREALETPGRTAALVTPDRNIARRVACELARFDIEIDDSGGKPLASTLIGELARLTAQIAQDGLTAVNVAALLAHPLTTLGLPRTQIAALSSLVEIGVLRGLNHGNSSWTERYRIARQNAKDWRTPPAIRRIDEKDWNAIEDILARVEDATALLLAEQSEAPLAMRAQAHRACLEAIASCDETISDSEGFQETLDLFVKLSLAPDALRFDAGGYAALFDHIAFETKLRGPRRAHPRLKILGPLEARLLDADVVLLAGLDEAIWPPKTDTGAFLNRSMRRQLGLTPPERRIGQSAHDVVMALGANHVVLSRAVKRNGSPTVVSRFLMRLRALAADAFEPAKKRGDRMLAIAATLDRPAKTESVERPTPCPPVALRPTQLGVTRIETLRRDPYAIYAERILNLVPLPPLGVEMGAREVGTAIHEALAAFARQCPKGPLPDDARERLLLAARARLGSLIDDPVFRVFNWPRIEAGLDHALSFERTRRDLNTTIYIEQGGALTIPLIDGTFFELTCQADRIEIAANGMASVFDYKTGKPPTNAEVGAGFAPQLTLEAAMIHAGAIETIGRRPVDAAAYVHLGGPSGGAIQWLQWKDKTFGDVITDHHAQLIQLLNQFRDPATPYVSRPFVAFASRFGDYDHLARVKEWSRGGSDEDV